MKTQSLLVCIALAMNGDHAPTGPYYPDVVCRIGSRPVEKSGVQSGRAAFEWKAADATLAAESLN